jgi:hypothetical protein
MTRQSEKLQLCLFEEDEPSVALTATQLVDLATLVEALLRDLAAMAKRGIAGSRSALQRFFDRHNVSFKKKSARGRAKASRRRARPPTVDARARHA